MVLVFFYFNNCLFSSVFFSFHMFSPCSAHAQPIPVGGIFIGICSLDVIFYCFYLGL